MSTPWGHFAETSLVLDMHGQFTQGLLSQIPSLYKFSEKMSFVQAISLLEVS